MQHLRPETAARSTKPSPEREGKATTGIAIVGCGYVADFYMATLPNHPELELRGAFDRDAARLAVFCGHHQIKAYADLEALTADPTVELVLNLTNPASHYAVSKSALSAGKHVYSEKPLTLDLQEARGLVELARSRGLSLAAAPATYLGEASQAVKTAVRKGAVGTVRVVYAELDDGMVYRSSCETWRSSSGAPWPMADEFAVGCTLQHASYYISWLCDLFGPVREVTAFATRQVDAKDPSLEPGELGDDFSVACLTFDGGVVARLTCGLLAPRDRRLRVVGDKGVITVEDGWDTRSRVLIRATEPASGGHALSRTLGRIVRRFPDIFATRRLSLPSSRYHVPVGHPGRLDYARGPAAQAAGIRSGTDGAHERDLALHVTEVALKIAAARLRPMCEPVSTSFEPDFSSHGDLHSGAAGSRFSASGKVASVGA